MVALLCALMASRGKEEAISCSCVSVAADVTLQGALMGTHPAKIPPRHCPPCFLPQAVAVGTTEQMVIPLEQTWCCCPPHGSEISELCTDVLCFRNCLIFAAAFMYSSGRPLP